MDVSFSAASAASAARADAVVLPRRGLYGPRGWSARAGVRPLLFGVFVDGPVDDYMPFNDLGPQAAARLLEVLPEAQLADR